MGTTLTGTTPANTYDSLIKVTDNGPLSGTLKTLTDGLGNDSALALSTSAIKVTGSISGTNGFNGFAGATHNLLVDWSANSQFTTLTATDIFFGTNANERMRITSTGNVGIGTSNPSGTLSVVPSATPITPTTASQITVGEASANTAYNLRIGYFANGGYKGSLQSIAGGIPSDLILNGDGGNVGIGTISPNRKLVIQAAAATSNEQLFYLKQENDNGYSFNLDGASTGNLNIKGVNFNAESASILTLNRSTLRVGVNNESPAVPLDVVGNIRTSTGILFGSDTAAANALDDYEEGTFTPVYFSGITGITYSGTSGAYTKIGNRVMFDIRLEVASYSTVTSSEVIVGGLPFATNSNLISNLTIGYFGIYRTDIVYGLIATNSTNAIYFYKKDASTLTGLDLTNVTSTIHISGVYFV